MTNILTPHYTSFSSKINLNPRNIFIAYSLTSFLLFLIPAYAQGQTEKSQPVKTEKQLQAGEVKTPTAATKPFKRSERPASEKGKNWKGVISKSRTITNANRAAPEAGFGDKTEAEIQKEKPREAKIGVLGAMTGQLKRFGMDASNGAELASDELNAKGGIRGKQFELLVFDTRGAIAGARQGVETLLRHKTIGIVGAATGEVSFSATKLLNDNQMIMVSAGSRRRLGDTGPYNFRNTLNDADGIGSLIDYISKNRKWKTVALFSSVLNDYSIQLNAIFKSKLMEHNYDITHELYLWSDAMSNIGEDEQTIVGQVKKLQKNPPDFVVFSGNGKEAVKVVNEMRRRSLNIPLMGAEDMDVPELAALGAKAAGALIYSGFNVNSKTPKVAAFVNMYKKKFGAPPTRLAALSYDTYQLLAQAIENAKSMRPSHVREALLSIKNFNGVTGVTSIGPTGEAVKKAFIFELKKQDGKYSFVNIQEGY
ncbi:MAG TPA: hypothetical protein ENI77_03770 [Nitrospirae bacterium]|nr:hypothetical protein [Nitrospirota bacterium]